MTSRLHTRAAVVLAVLASAYVAAQVLADIASLRIVDVFGFSLDGGTLIYPFTFTLRDLVQKVAGKRVAQTLIFSAAAINLVMALLFLAVANLPADMAVGAQAEFGTVLGPVWRIVFASIVAEIISELIDTEVYSAWVTRMGDRKQWGRVLSSNAVSVPIDSAIFVLIAFLGVLPFSVVVEIFWVNVLVKGLVTLISIPWIYMVKPDPVVAE